MKGLVILVIVCASIGFSEVKEFKILHSRTLLISFGVSKFRKKCQEKKE